MLRPPALPLPHTHPSTIHALANPSLPPLLSPPSFSPGFYSDIGHVEDSALFTNDAKKAVGYIELIEQEEVLSVDAMKRLRFVKEAIIGEDLYLTKITGKSS